MKFTILLKIVLFVRRFTEKIKIMIFIVFIVWNTSLCSNLVFFDLQTHSITFYLGAFKKFILENIITFMFISVTIVIIIANTLFYAIQQRIFSTKDLLEAFKPSQTLTLQVFFCYFERRILSQLNKKYWKWNGSKECKNFLLFLHVFLRPKN